MLCLGMTEGNECGPDLKKLSLQVEMMEPILKFCFDFTVVEYT